jgi:two-component system, NarL family, response regulator
MNKSDQIRVMAVDDHPVVRRGIRAILAAEPSLVPVGEAATGAEAISRYRELLPDIVLMDLRLNGEIDGVETTARIRSEWPQAKVIVLTTYGGDENIHRALEAGALGYLIKDAIDEDLLIAIKTVQKGRRYIPAYLALSLVEHGMRVELTPRERQVLRLLAEGLRNKEIASKLNIAEATSRTHVENIVAKLGASSRTEAVVIAAQRGFLGLG